ncbi:MAG: hypothetical protein MJA29_13235 [Candidatus Omnitrophica bacterium]|nr:hypothetical protein [Candidatus Omnitrophota bacterium]
MVRAVILVMVMSMVIASGGLFAVGVCSEDAPAASPAAEPETVKVGNTICPVTGEAVEDATKTTYVHEGREYNLCCPACIEIFKADPGKYIAIVQEAMESPVEAAEEAAELKDEAAADAHSNY